MTDRNAYKFLMLLVNAEKNYLEKIWRDEDMPDISREKYEQLKEAERWITAKVNTLNEKEYSHAFS